MPPPAGAWRRMPANRYYKSNSVAARRANTGFAKPKRFWTKPRIAGAGLATAVAGLGGLLGGLLSKKKKQTVAGRRRRRPR